MYRDLEAAIAQWNEEYDLEMDLETVAEIYGEDITERMEESSPEVIGNVEYLLQLGFGDGVSDIFNRYGIILMEDNHIFRENVQALIRDLGPDYAQKLGEDMSAWETLL